MQGDETCPSACFKGTVEVNVPLTYALQYVTNLDFKVEWDDLFQGGMNYFHYRFKLQVRHLPFHAVLLRKGFFR